MSNEPLLIKPGDNISWTHVSRRGKSLSMSLRCGTVEAIEGDAVTVIRPTGRRETIKLERLRRPGQKSQVTEFVEAVVEASRKPAI
jgi:transcriptional regulator NrdR family protein